MALEIVRNDITNMQADAIVNTANPRPVIGGGTDSAIHQKAGPELLEARRAIGDIPVGQAAVTPAFGLNAKYVIHAVSPAWRGGGQGEEALLRRTYRSALEQALAHHCRSVAFPLLSAGTYGFPPDRALAAAVEACNGFLLQHRMKIYLVVFNREAFHLSHQLVSRVESYIDQHYVDAREAEERRYPGRSRRLRQLDVARAEGCRSLDADEAMLLPMADDRRMAEVLPEGGEQDIARLRRSLEQRLRERQETFSQAMMRIIREKDLQDTEVYMRILMDRKTFNKIKNDPDHHPQKRTALQLAIALRLNLDQTRDLLAKAGYTLSDSSRSDVILSYCIEEQLYSVDEIDGILYHFGEKTLFTKA